MLKYTSEDQIPYGYCHCGCGQKTEIAKVSNAHFGWVKGEPYQYIRHHSSRKRNQYNQAQIFWSKVAITADDNQCWLWLGGLNEDYYGLITWNNKVMIASRVAWMYPDYVIPDGMFVCHSCDNPRCCNPKHLFIGTHQDNMTDMARKGRMPKGSKHHKSKLTELEVEEMRRLHKLGIKGVELAHKYNVSISAISRIVNHKVRK